MSLREPSFTIGMEEEYLLIDMETRDLASDPPRELMEACEKALGEHVAPEFLRCQIEVGTPVCANVQEARLRLAEMRATIAQIAEGYGLAPLAVSTHPFADWVQQRHTDKDRYNELARDLQVVVRRLLICGMHVHVAIEDEALRIDLFNQLPYFLPHLLALSTSSPFWQGEMTGLKSYRLSVFNELPRTGLPETFDSFGQYERTVGVLVQTGLIEDATKVWWDLRPSARFPTLEMRVTDVCTRIEDAVAIAATFRCLARMLYRLRTQNQRWRTYSRFLINENRWHAQRYGVSKGMIDFGRGELVDMAALMEELTDILREDAEHFGCVAELEHLRTIAARGTSADRQMRIYEEATAQGADAREALNRVVDDLRKETLEGC